MAFNAIIDLIDNTWMQTHVCSHKLFRQIPGEHLQKKHK